MKAVHLIGTSHQYQVRGTDVSVAYDAFRLVVLDAARAHRVSIIAEELSLEAEQQGGGQGSVCREVADELCLAHCYCDPDTVERTALDIEGMPAIKNRIFFAARRGATQDERDEEAKPQIRNSNDKREREWLSRLTSQNLFPVLFVCGADHVDSFAALLWKHDINVHVVHRDWQNR